MTALAVLAVLPLACRQPKPVEQVAATVATDPLPSWNDGQLKQSIIEFVSKTTTEGSPDFIPVADRIATFDNDGTLWAEQPVIQGLFAFSRVKDVVEKNPSLKSKQPFRAVLEGDHEYLHKMEMEELVGLVMATHTGMNQQEFETKAQEFFATARHPKLGVPIANLVYKPQVELLQYLRANGFKTFICSGGTVELMRVIGEEYYGIPDEQVIGSTFKYTFDEESNSIMREGALNSLDDKKEKPVNIQYHIGKRPVFACGNERSGGDIYMLRFSQGNKYPSYQLLVNHDDEAREFLYQEADSISLKWAKKYNWNVVSMKNDWKEIFVK